VKIFQNNFQKINSELDKISRTSLTNVEKVLYLLPNFIRTQDNVMKQKEGEFIAAFERITDNVMDTYELFLRKKPEIQKQWLIFMEDLDKELKKSLQASVKSTLMQFGKHIMGDKGQDTELVAIFTVYTILNIDNNDKWNIVHDPTHEELKLELQAFMRKIIKVTRVVPRIERVFREKRELVIGGIKKQVEDADRAGANTNTTFDKNGIKGDTNYQNLDEEQKQQWWVDRFELPPEPKKKADYVDRILKVAKVQDKMTEILKGIDAVEQATVEDKRMWDRSEEKRQISGYMNSRGRFLNKFLNSSDEDPVAQYNDILEQLTSVTNDISNRPSMKSERFINLDCSKLKASLQDHVNEIQQMIFTNLVKEAKRDLNNLLNEWTTIYETLRK